MDTAEILRFKKIMPMKEQSTSIGHRGLFD